MRYFLFFGLIFLTLFIFSTQSQAADVVEMPNHKTIKVEDNVIPIEPIKPIEPKANKHKFWQKKFKFNQQQNEIEPIASSWYTFMGVYVILSLVGFLLAGLYFLVLSVFGFVSFAFVVLGLILLGAVASILYAIKLFAAARGQEGFLMGWRFALGYIVGILFTISWVGVAIPFFGITTAILGVVLPAAILIFNIIDHVRYRKYLKMLENKPQ